MTICKARGTVFVAALAFLAACQTSGTDGVLSNALPTAEDAEKQDGQQVAGVQQPGRNPNANTRFKNTRTDLTDYCPAVRIRAGTETYRIIPEGKSKTDPDAVRYQATITKVARECNYIGQNLEIKVGARGRIISGPAGGPGDVNMPIRVAVTRGNDTIYSQLYRPIETIAQGSTNTQFSFVDDKVIIPAPTATNIRVYIGFDEGPYDTP
ncbi:MAG: hypothetical protein AAGF28_03595 [Pseudomonadota bacterium]